METGKVEYAPDYKSRKGVQFSNSSGRAFADIGEVVESELERLKASKTEANVTQLAQLERAVIEAAKKWHQPNSKMADETALDAAVEALIAFESKEAE